TARRLAFHSFPTRRSSDLSVFICVQERVDHTMPAVAKQHIGAGSKWHDLQVSAAGQIHVEVPIAIGDAHAIDGGSDCILKNRRKDRKSTRLNSSHVKISYA